ncbi:MAG: hypothetical protein EXR62_18285 [Chloroflexi bacterium]|nr:hypothetical protein [Chloroflexota bacterium]
MTKWNYSRIGLLALMGAVISILSVLGRDQGLQQSLGKWQARQQDSLAVIVHAETMTQTIYIPFVVKGMIPPSPTSTSTPLATSTPSGTPTRTATAIATATMTPSRTPSATPTTSTATVTATPTATPSSSGKYTFIDTNHGLTQTNYIDLEAQGVSPFALPQGDEIAVTLRLDLLTPSFSFPFYGANYSRLSVISNGYMVAGSISNQDIQHVNEMIPTSTLPNNLIAPYWTDLDLSPTGSGEVYAGILSGQGISRTLIVQFKNIARFEDPSTTINFELVIGENQSNILMVYGPITDTVNTLSVGLENYFGTEGTQYYYNGSPADYRPTAGLGILWQYQAGTQLETDLTRRLQALQMAPAGFVKVERVPFELVKRQKP